MINAAIVGLGRWGQNLVNSIQGKSDKIRIVAGATRTVSKAADYAKQQGFALHGAYEKVLADPKIDAIIVATPHTQRVEIIAAAAQAGKHVFTEKPLALNRRDAEACVKACADHKVTLAVGYNWRFQPALQEIKRMLDRRPPRQTAAYRGQFLRSERVPLRPRSLAPESRGRPGRRHDRPRRARRRCDAVSHREHRYGARAKFPPRARLRHRRHDFHAVPVQKRRDRVISAHSSRPPRRGACRCSAKRAGPRSATSSI